MRVPPTERPCSNDRVTSDANCIEANVQYAKAPGYHVSIDLEIPRDALTGTRADGGPMGHLRLTDAEADLLAAQLAEMAARARGLAAQAHEPEKT
jgi:hypothetical protein